MWSFTRNNLRTEIALEESDLVPSHPIYPTPHFSSPRETIILPSIISHLTGSNPYYPGHLTLAPIQEIGMGPCSQKTPVSPQLFAISQA